MPNPEDISRTSEKVTKKAATLVETAADIAEEAFESAVDRADMVSAATATKLVSSARTTNKLAKQHSRALGIGAMMAGAAAVIGGLALLGMKAKGGKAKKAKSDPS